MNKYVIFSLACFLNCITHCQDVIDGASYYVVEGKDEITGFFGSGKKAIYYSYDGNLLEETELQKQTKLSDLKQKLDLSAPKPQPVSYKIKYWPAISFGWGLTKGQPGDFIIFYDKNDNSIEGYRFNKESNVISQWTEYGQNNFNLDFVLLDSQKFPLDLSIVKEEKEKTVQNEKENNTGSCIIL